MKYSEFYLAFENKFRGSSLDVNEKLVFYDGLLQEISSRFSACSLLDIGCGRGEWLVKCIDIGINSFGIDNNDTMFKVCQEKGLNIKHGEALDVLKTIENNSFHIISSFHFIEHISFEMFLQILEECKRVLIPGGALILETPSIDNILVSSKDFYLDPTHVTHMHPETVIFALEYFKFTEAKYFLINKSLYQKYGSESINNIVSSPGLDVAIIASYNTNKEGIPLFDKSLNWMTNLRIAKNTFQICNEYDNLMNERILNLSKKIDFLHKQIDTLLYFYDKIFNSFPLRFFRKIKASIHLIKAISVKIIKLIASKILSIYLIEKVYLKICKVLFNNKLDLYVNTKHDSYLNQLFKSNPRSKEILSDIKTKLKS